MFAGHSAKRYQQGETAVQHVFTKVLTQSSEARVILFIGMHFVCRFLKENCGRCVLL